MAFITVTNTFSNASLSDGTQINTNFSDITNGLTVGNKDIAVRNADVISATVSSLVHTGSALGFFGASATTQFAAITAPSTVTMLYESLVTIFEGYGLTA